jgi:hypothetical protein
MLWDNEPIWLMMFLASAPQPRHPASCPTSQLLGLHGRVLGVRKQSCLVQGTARKHVGAHPPHPHCGVQPACHHHALASGREGGVAAGDLVASAAAASEQPPCPQRPQLHRHQRGAGILGHRAAYHYHRGVCMWQHGEREDRGAPVVIEAAETTASHCEDESRAERIN